MMSLSAITSTLDKTACLVSLSFNLLMRDILTHLATSDTLSLQWQTLLHGTHHGKHVDIVALPYRGQQLNLLQQIHHRDLVNSVPEGIVQGFAEGVIVTLQQLVLQLGSGTDIGISFVTVRI